MTLPRSPHMPSIVDPVGGIGIDRVSQDVFRTLCPPSIQNSVSPISPKSTLDTSSFTAANPEPFSSSSRGASTEAMKVEESMTVHWTGEPDRSTDHTTSSNMNFHMPGQLGMNAGNFYSYGQNGMSYNNNYNIPYASQYPISSGPRSFNRININGLPRDVDMSESYPPAVYQIEPQKHYDTQSDHGLNDYLMQMEDDYEYHNDLHTKLGGHAGYNSPYSDLTQASTPSCDSPRHPLDTIGEIDAMIDKDQPYAQLIYQALLQADGHTMILRDIYDWFIKYTDKPVASETKGWQNSIRHNLSMNGAFEKVDLPCEESRKGFMWRLTEKALREGVKSTTRYRSKQPNKRGNRTQQPQPQRQASGAKGGQATRRSANLKRSKRVPDYQRNKPYVARSIPAAFNPPYTNSHNQTYPPSPYYGSDIGYTFNPNHPPQHNSLEHFSMNSPQFGAMGDSAYVLVQSPSEPLFTDSPTPSAEEPRTPGWSGTEFGGVWEEGDGVLVGFQEYAG